MKKYDLIIGSHILSNPIKSSDYCLKSMQRVTNCLIKSNLKFSGGFGFVINGRNGRSLLSATRRRLPVGKAHKCRARRVLGKELPRRRYIHLLYIWDAFFKSATAGVQPGLAYQSPPGLASGTQTQPSVNMTSMTAQTPNVSAVGLRDIEDHLAVQYIIRSYQVRGHLSAKLDPLGITMANIHSPLHFGKHIDSSWLKIHNFGEKDMDRPFKLPSATFIGGGESILPLREILKRLEDVYCQHIGVEYMYIPDIEECHWIREKFETPKITQLTVEQKRTLLARVTRSHKFEEFLAKKWSSEKRFGLEGCEVLIPAMKAIIDCSSELGVESFVMGMPHRGRLNVLANVCRKPLEHIFSRFSSLEPADEGSGDVKYHLGMSHERHNRVSNKKI
ncbi:unnamed protein product, partial [Medioppia subpectinata]